MGYSFKIDKDRRLVTVIVFNALDKESILAFRQELVAHPDFNPDFNQLMEYKPNTKLAMSSQEVSELKFNDPFSPTSRRAAVAYSDVLFGYARMYASLMESRGYDNIKVFRDLNEALLWINDRKD